MKSGVFLLFFLICTIIFPLSIRDGAQAEDILPSRDFNISKIVLCDPGDPLCKPRLFFEAGETIRINVLQNFSPALKGISRDLILFFYNKGNKEVLKAYKVEQFIWGPHINDKWLCFLSNTMDSGVYKIRIVVKVGEKEFEKTTTFSLVNSAKDARREEIERIEKEREKARTGEENEDNDNGKPQGL